ncbi:MAG: cytidine deaminase [Defluviitaleaceae bacterium]|nr:cytidine deaminase [Defluviitaleaceae bacterium]
MNDKELIKLAVEARKRSYSPYSKFAVGAALLTKSGEVFLGCNIESAAFTPTCCAERTAIFKAVSEGHVELEAIAVAGAPHGKDPDGECAPCGVCRQMLVEFCEPLEFKIILGTPDKHTAYTLEELLPRSFGKKDL